MLQYWFNRFHFRTKTKTAVVVLPYVASAIVHFTSKDWRKTAVDKFVIYSV